MTLQKYNRSINEVIFFAFAFGVTFLSRYPGFLSKIPLNPDESLIGAAAITQVSRGFTPWVDLDTTTFGPATNWPMGFLILLGVPLTYTSLHIIAALLWSASATLNLLIIKYLFGLKWSYLGFLIILIASSIGWRADFLHLSGASLPNFFLLIGASIVAWALVKPITKYHGLLTALVALNCSFAVLGKLQALPPALFLCIFIIFISGKTLKDFLKSLLYCLLGFLLPWLFLYGFLALNDQLGGAVKSYWKAGPAYAVQAIDAQSWIKQLIKDIIGGWWIMQPLWVLNLILLPVATISVFFNYNLINKQLLLNYMFVFGWFLATLSALILPNNRWPHHGIFLLAPCITLSVALFCTPFIFRSRQKISKVPVCIEWIQNKPFKYMFICILFWVGFIMFRFPYYKKHLAWSPKDMGDDFSENQLQVVDFIKSNTLNGEPISVWGCEPDIFVLSQRPSATRHLIGHFLIDENPLKEFHRKSYIEDLMISKPKIVVDAMTEGFYLWQWKDKPLATVRNFSALSDYLDKHYKSVQDYKQHDRTQHSMIYIRKN
jgi:hypothetical protein